MKTLRFTLIALLVAFAAATFANTDGFTTKPGKKIVNISLQEAVKLPGLVIAMYNQLNDEFLSNNQLTYTKNVVCGGVIFRITGTYDQWTLFFRHKTLVKEDYFHFEIDGDN